ncbi:TlpA family protein disulfide reductase [bacterium]|nr:TlpA family protein disulfide reductase [bacterium]
MSFSITPKIIIALILLTMSQLYAQKLLPDFLLETPSGEVYTRDDILGKGPVVINFWATWCIPCMAEMTQMIPIYEKYKSKGLQVVSISIDDSKTASKIPIFVRRKKFPFLILVDPAKDLYSRLGISNVPELLVLNSKGEILLHHQGYHPGDEKETEKLIESLFENKQ